MFHQPHFMAYRRALCCAPPTDSLDLRSSFFIYFCLGLLCCTLTAAWSFTPSALLSPSWAAVRCSLPLVSPSIHTLPGLPRLARSNDCGCAAFVPYSSVPPWTGCLLLFGKQRLRRHDVRRWPGRPACRRDSRLFSFKESASDWNHTLTHNEQMCAKSSALVGYITHRCFNLPAAIFTVMKDLYLSQVCFVFELRSSKSPPAAIKASAALIWVRWRKPIFWWLPKLFSLHPATSLLRLKSCPHLFSADHLSLLGCVH